MESYELSLSDIWGCRWCKCFVRTQGQACRRISGWWYPHYWCLACRKQEPQAPHPTKNSSVHLSIEELLQLFDQACDKHDRKTTCSWCHRNKLVRYGDEIKNLTGTVVVFDTGLLDPGLASGTIHKREFSSLTQAQTVARSDAQATERTRQQIEVYKEALSEIQRKAEEASQCVVCLDAPKTMLLYPCLHICMCTKCVSHCPRCPLCRNHFRMFL